LIDYFANMAKTTSKKKNARKRHAKSRKGKKPYDSKKLAKASLVTLNAWSAASGISEIAAGDQ